MSVKMNPQALPYSDGQKEYEYIDNQKVNAQRACIKVIGKGDH